MKRYIKGKSNKSLIDTAVKEAINMFMENDYDYVLNKIENNEPSDPTYALELDHEIDFLKK